MEKVLGFAEALETVLAEARRLTPVGVERVALLEARGRTLAEQLRADRDQPPFDRSTRDGFALKAADAGKPLRVVGQVRAGEVWQGDALREGEAVEIMTGAPLPDGSDCVVMLEYVQLAAGDLQIAAERVPRAGENVVARGTEAREGSTVLDTGSVVEPAEIALAASLGHGELLVHARPSVAIIATGDELVELAEMPEAWQIRNSNSYGLAALVCEEGGQAAQLGVARDTAAEVARLVEQGVHHNLLLLSGGVSMGKYDVVEQVLLERGAEFFFTGALIQPGKPVVFGRLPRGAGEWTYFFGLPGNPVSTQVTFRLFVAPMLCALLGQHETAPRFAEARLGEDIRGGMKVTRFLPAELRSAWNGATVQPVTWQGSGDLAANARANCYVVLPAGVERFTAGETVRVLLR